MARKAARPSASDRQDPAHQVFGAGQQFLQRVVIQAAQNQNLKARQQGGVEFERRILGGGANQDDRSIFDIGKKTVLLGPVEPVDLVDEQKRTPPHGAPLGCGIEYLSDRSATPENTADNGSKARSVRSARRRAMVVLPEPGGPHRTTEDNRPWLTMRASGPSPPTR